MGQGRVKTSTTKGQEKAFSVSAETLTKKERLSKDHDFNNVYKEGASYHSQHFKLHTLKNGLPHNRIGIRIAVSTIRNSTDRNKVRRIIKEVYRKNRKGPGLGPGLDFIVRTRKAESSNIPFDVVQKELLELFKKAKITI